MESRPLHADEFGGLRRGNLGEGAALEMHSIESGGDAVRPDSTTVSNEGTG
jgi:hypothetical protein